MIGPAVGANLDVMAATMVAAIDQHAANTGIAHFPERFLRVGGHGGPEQPVEGGHAGPVRRIGQPGLDRPPDQQRESLVRYFGAGLSDSGEGGRCARGLARWVGKRGVTKTPVGNAG
jgi:hypothetical protein